jgi:Flp pilus assembly protein TadD
MNLEEGGRTQNDEEARRMLRQASELAPTLDEPMYRLGLLAKREGDFARAQSYFQHAVQRNPRHVEAQREIRLMRSRGETKPAKGVLDSIIGRKAKP